MLCFVLLNVVKIAKPSADSVAAIVNINKTKTCPIISSRYIEKAIKFRLTANNINSKDIIIIIIFFLFKTNPIIPVKNKKVVNIKISPIYIICMNILGFEPVVFDVTGRRFNQIKLHFQLKFLNIIEAEKILY